MTLLDFAHGGPLPVFIKLAFGLFVTTLPSPILAAGEAQVLSGANWQTTPVNTVSSLDGFRASDNFSISKYGGRMDRKVEATGFFRTERIGERWWLVDPDGYLFISAGICSVDSSQTDLKKTDFGSKEGWAAATNRLLRGNSFNTLGCWSDWASFKDGNRMPYTRRWNFMSTFGKQLKVTEKAFGHTGFKNRCMPIFHPDFESFCSEHAKQLVETKDDSWLLGHFSDNELPFRPNALDLYLSLPKASHGYQAAKAWWDARIGNTGGDRERTRKQDDQDAFLEYLANRYYSIVAAAIRKYDPNHLFLGSRVHGRTISPATFRGSKAVDVVSVNYYHRWTPEPKRLAAWAEAAGAPVLISEWYAMSLPYPDTRAHGAGFRVKSAHDRGLFYAHFALELLKHPDCVGWHWFKYSGDDDTKTIGIVDQDYTPHADFLKIMGELNRQLYPLADHFAVGPVRSETSQPSAPDRR